MKDIQKNIKSIKRRIVKIWDAFGSKRRLKLAVPVVLVLAISLILTFCMPQARQKNPKDITFEIYPEKEIRPQEKWAAPSEHFTPRVAVIIDDIGYDESLADKFMNLDVPLTFSVLPFSPYEKSIVKKASLKGIEIMLHQPMEPVEYPFVKPGPGALYISMTPQHLKAQLLDNLKTMPYVKGVNNHMGSKMTSVSGHMYQIFSILKQRGLFYIDSLTTHDSVCPLSARLLQIPFAQRDVFLDHVPDSSSIEKQLRQLIDIAVSQGEAIGIGHPHKATYKVIHDMLPEMKKKVEIVPVSMLVHTAG